MERLSRREVLGASTALVALSAGCLTDGGVIGGDTDSSDEPASNGSTDDEDDSSVLSSIEAADGIESAGFVRYSHSQPPAEARAELFTSVEDVESWLDSASGQIEPNGPAATALRETDYGSSRAIAIEAQAPDGCHQLTVSDVSLDDDGAISVSTSLEEADDGDDMCTQQLTAEGAVVRATTAEPPNEASVSVSFPDGSSVGIGMASNSASAGDSQGDSSSDDA
ncbi:hypothetical protein Halru_3082 [Halovivax ruber XH-70]|uniref:Uncharacterized protein n=1 Tax=Halovivax ruber (strain DSM 18193 / JCM 13892 / XH-70) TaxID=797302 RepID=L0IFM6_HALRX|nr:hypothetical protein [Halovivax ruber]AGB17648.1 hypothetical protein Halru_3082 [Halovivax ruber XH-70]